MFGWITLAIIDLFGSAARSKKGINASTLPTLETKNSSNLAPLSSDYKDTTLTNHNLGLSGITIIEEHEEEVS